MATKKREIKQLIALFIFPKRTVDWGVFIYLEGLIGPDIFCTTECEAAILI